MKPNIDEIKIDNNLEKIKKFLNEMIIQPRKSLRQWAIITNQTPAAKLGYIGQHLASLITGVQGTGTGARGDDLSDGSEVKSCNKTDQVDKCKQCGTRVMRFQTRCPRCNSSNITRRGDSKWLFSVRDQYEFDLYLKMERIVLIIMDYPDFKTGLFNDIRIRCFEIYPKEKRMQVFAQLLSNHYYHIFLPKQDAKEKTNPMNLHPDSFQFYKCNPLKTFECIIKDVDDTDKINLQIRHYIEPMMERDYRIDAEPMPSTLLERGEWDELFMRADFENDIKPLLASDYTKAQFEKLTVSEKQCALPFLDEKLRNYIPLRKIVSTRQRQHYQRS